MQRLKVLPICQHFFRQIRSLRAGCAFLLQIEKEYRLLTVIQVPLCYNERMKFLVVLFFLFGLPIAPVRAEIQASADGVTAEC